MQHPQTQSNIPNKQHIYIFILLVRLATYYTYYAPIGLNEQTNDGEQSATQRTITKDDDDDYINMYAAI